MTLRVFILLYLFLAVAPSAFSGDISIDHDLSYSPEVADKSSDNLLDVYYPKNRKGAKDVLVFIHGGSWNSGKKETYWWLGRNMANNNVITVIINYSLSPASQYAKMAGDCARALKWVSAKASSYGGDPRRIFVMGHSAGGHLAALINSDPKFFRQEQIENPIRGLILNDAFGLDMFEYLNVAEDNAQTRSFLDTFSQDREAWRVGSPMYYIQNSINPTLIFVGQRTYEAIRKQSDRLHNKLQILGKPSELRIIPRKKHVGMISQMILRGNKLYDYILDFMRRT